MSRLDFIEIGGEGEILGGEDKKLIVKEYSSLFQGDEKIIILILVTFAQLCEYTKKTNVWDMDISIKLLPILLSPSVSPQGNVSNHPYILLPYLCFYLKMFIINSLGINLSL